MIKYELIESIMNIEKDYGETLQLNLIKWSNNPPKYDLRKWDSNDNPQKGVTLDNDELYTLYLALKEIYEEEEHEEYEEEEDVEFDWGEISDDELPFGRADRVDIEDIDFRKFLIHTDSFEREHASHDYEKIKASIYVMNRFGSVEERTVDAYYCYDCKNYYITEYNYNQLKQNGHIMCSVFSKKEFEDFIETNELNLKTVSFIKSKGYNVGKQDDLRDSQRRTILDYIVESGDMSKSQIISHLNFLVRLNEGKRSMADAVEKWKSDVDYLKGTSTQTNGIRKVGIKYIVK